MVKLLYGINLTKFVSLPENELKSNLDYRQLYIYNFLQAFQVLDIASNEGLFSILAARFGHSVLSIGSALSTIDRLYNFKKK